MLPERIILYRDGVGDGQLETLKNCENQQLFNVFSKFGEDYNPKFTIVICQKRINTKIMKQVSQLFTICISSSVIIPLIYQRHIKLIIPNKIFHIGQQ